MFNSKTETKTQKTAADFRPAGEAPASGAISTIGSGMLVTGNIVSTGGVQIFGRVLGDVHVAQLNIGNGAYVEGKVIAQEISVDGAFKGTIHGNTVKLRATAVVDGEIFNKSLMIEQDAQFEGVARRLDKPVEAPSNPKSGSSTSSAEVVHLTRAAE